MPRVSMLMVRLAIVWSFVGILPLLALPPVNQRVNQWIHAIPASSLAATSSSDSVGSPGEDERGPRIVDRDLVVDSSVTSRDSAVGSPSKAVPESSSSDASVDGAGRPGGPLHADSLPSPRTPLWEPQRVMAIQERLKELGARYLILENLRERQLYRFHCRVDVGEHAIYARVFESLDTQPQRAMERVLGDVEAWMSAQRVVDPPFSDE